MAARTGHGDVSGSAPGGRGGAGVAPDGRGAAASASSSSTASRALDTAERLVQVRGFNGFSYADIAAELQITKASLHYHFATKADLGEALINRYSARFFQALAEVDAGGAAAPAKLAAYAKLYADVLSEQKMCLCGMLAAEYPTLPLPMQAAVVGFFDHNEGWLEVVLEQGRRGAQPGLRRAGQGHRPDDRQRSGRGDAGDPALPGRRPVPGGRREPARQPHRPG